MQGGGDGAQSDAASGTGRGQAGDLGDGLGVDQQAAALGEERPARVGESDGAVGALQQLCADLAFQAADRLGQRWLRHLQARCGTAEVQLLGHGHEVSGGAQLKDDIHCLSIVDTVRPSEYLSSALHWHHE